MGVQLDVELLIGKTIFMRKVDGNEPSLLSPCVTRMETRTGINDVLLGSNAAGKLFSTLLSNISRAQQAGGQS